MIYFDNSATTKPSKEVINDIKWCLENMWGNPSSIHSEGYKAKKILIESREKVAKFINAKPEEIIFTNSGSESNNLAIRGFLEAEVNNRFDCIITTEMEHPSVYNTCKYMNKTHFTKIVYAPLSNGMVDSKKFNGLISELSHFHYCFVSIMLVNNEIGTINDIKKIAKLVHQHNGILHVDATAAVSSLLIDVEELECDLLTFSGHKLNCPKGIGVLYKKKGVTLSPIIYGGHQENGLVAGTENVPYIYALGNQVENVCINYCVALSTKFYLYSCIECVCKKLKIKHTVNGDFKNTIPTVLSITFENINAEALIILLDTREVCVSAGSACSSGDKTPSRVLKAIGLTDEEAFGTVRISIDKYTTFKECEDFADILEKCLQMVKY